MSTGSGEAVQEALAATIATALRHQGRRSVHPADQTALRHAAARIAVALQADFMVIRRHSAVADQPERKPMNEPVHE